MSILSSAAEIVTDGKRWDQNPFLAIGITPKILQAGLTDEDLFAICQKIARSRLAEAHPDRSNEENEEQRVFSTAFGFLKNPTTFDIALKELRDIASGELHELSRLKRDLARLKQEQENAYEHAASISAESAKIRARTEPVEAFLMAYLRASALRIEKRKPIDWAIPGAEVHGTSQKIRYAMLWAHPNTSAHPSARHLENFIGNLLDRAKKEGGFPWDVVGTTKPRTVHEHDFKSNVSTIITLEQHRKLEAQYPHALLDLRYMSEAMRVKTTTANRAVHAADIICGMRASSITPDRVMLVSTTGGSFTRYLILGSLQPPNNPHDMPVTRFGSAGFPELPWESAILGNKLVPVLYPGWLLVGMKVKEITTRAPLEHKPTVGLFRSMQPDPLVVLGSILSIE